LTQTAAKGHTADSATLDDRRQVQAEIIKFDEFELDLGRYELRRQGRPLKLEKIPMELLILLAEREGQLVTREEIIHRLWGDNVYVDTRQGINTAVRKLRLALKDDPDDPRILLTVVGKGYRLLAPISSSRPEVEMRASSLHQPASSRSQDGCTTMATAVVVIDPQLARALFLVIQAGYLVLYGVAFAHLSQIRTMRLPAATPGFTLGAGLAGSAMHLYLAAAVALNYAESGRLFRQMFPAILAVDVAWAASPLFLFERWGELTLLFVAALVFLPFSQRTLIRSAYGHSGGL
jgi:DNA-binding winged helix-turn-helix (wHTH) protein